MMQSYELLDQYFTVRSLRKGASLVFGFNDEWWNGCTRITIDACYFEGHIGYAGLMRDLTAGAQLRGGAAAPGTAG